MAIIIEASSYAKEQRVVIPGTSPACIAFSGYARFNDEALKGSPESDYESVTYLAEMVVGPQWSSVIDASPTVSVAGIAHYSSDEADATGYEVRSCTWEGVNSEDLGLRIRLRATVRVKGGPDATVTALAYHVVAVGKAG